MDRYAFVLNIVEKAHIGAQELSAACDQLNGLKDAHQRLVSTYGRERVSASGTNVNPALEAIIRYEEEIEALEQRIDTFNKAQKKVKDFISIIKNRNYSQLLEMYCLLGWSHARISRSVNRSISTVKRRHQTAIEIIAQELNKKEAGA